MALISRQAWEEIAGGVMTVNETAEFLRVSRSTIYRWLLSGDLVWTTIGRRKRIPRKSAERMLARNVTGAPEPAAS